MMEKIKSENSTIYTLTDEYSLKLTHFQTVIIVKDRKNEIRIEQGLQRPEEASSTLSVHLNELETESLYNILKEKFEQNQSLTPKTLVLLRCNGCGERYNIPGDEYDEDEEIECDNCKHDLTVIDRDIMEEK